MIPELGKFWTAANVLSLLRAVLAIPVTVMIIQDESIWWIISLILVSALTDWLDGRLARWSRTVSNWGKVLDPLCDKVAVLLISAALAIEESLPLWFVMLIAVRDVLIVTGSVFLTRHIGEVKMSIWWGKIAVSAMALTILAAILKADPVVMKVCIGLTVALMLISYTLYVIRYIRLTP